MNRKRPLWLLSALLFAGCATASESEQAQDAAHDASADPEDAASAGPEDAAFSDASILLDGGQPSDGGQDAGAVDAGADSGLLCDTPSGPYGPAIGERLAPLTLPTCDEATMEFYCDTPIATVFSQGYEWARPSIELARSLGERVSPNFRPRGVRFVQVLIEGNAPRVPADSELCERWSDHFSFGTITLDHAGSTISTLFADPTIPTTVVVDQDGIIRHRFSGASAMLLDELEGALTSLVE